MPWPPRTCHSSLWHTQSCATLWRCVGGLCLTQSCWLAAGVQGEAGRWRDAQPLLASPMSACQPVCSPPSRPPASSLLLLLSRPPSIPSRSPSLPPTTFNLHPPSPPPHLHNPPSPPSLAGSRRQSTTEWTCCAPVTPYSCRSGTCPPLHDTAAAAAAARARCHLAAGHQVRGRAHAAAQQRHLHEDPVGL